MPEVGPAFVVAACIRRGEEILLAQRYQPDSPQAHLRWEMPGGKVKFEETPHGALAREIHEELGTDIHLVRLLPHVQSTVYTTPAKKLHSIVVAFECTLSPGAPEPKPLEPGIRQIRWVRHSEAAALRLLPGTSQFLACLERGDQATYAATTQIHVRLERRDEAGSSTHYWELQTLYDLWSQYNLVERHGSLAARSSRYRLTPDIGEEDLMPRLVQRIRTLTGRGYRITRSNDPRVETTL